MERTPGYVQEVLDEERKATEKEKEKGNGGHRNNFLSLLLQLSDEDLRLGQSQFSLTNEEISRSLFISTTAGYETTANTMGYTVTLLAAYTQWQDWIREELQTLPEHPSTWRYEEIYSKCRRTLAVVVRPATCPFFVSVQAVDRSIYAYSMKLSATSHPSYTRPAQSSSPSSSPRPPARTS